MTLNSDVKRETYIKDFQSKGVERVKPGVKQNSTLCSEQWKPEVFGGNWAKACLKGICGFALAFSNRALPISAPTLESLEDQDDPNPWSWTVGPLFLVQETQMRKHNLSPVLHLRMVPVIRQSTDNCSDTACFCYLGFFCSSWVKLSQAAQRGPTRSTCTWSSHEVSRSNRCILLRWSCRWALKIGGRTIYLILDLQV